MGMCPGAVTQMPLPGCRGKGKAKQCCSVQEMGFVTKRRNLSELKFIIFLSNPGYDSNAARFVLRDLRTTARCVQ